LPSATSDAASPVVWTRPQAWPLSLPTPIGGRASGIMPLPWRPTRQDLPIPRAPVPGHRARFWMRSGCRHSAAAVLPCALGAGLRSECLIARPSLCSATYTTDVQVAFREKSDFSSLSHDVTMPAANNVGTLMMNLNIAASILLVTVVTGCTTTKIYNLDRYGVPGRYPDSPPSVYERWADFDTLFTQYYLSPDWDYNRYISKRNLVILTASEQNQQKFRFFFRQYWGKDIEPE
jgi:hypothetical protein